MAIVLTAESRVLIQGITGKAGVYHCAEMRRQNTRVVAGVSPGKGGQVVDGVPVYDTVSEAVRRHEVDVSLVLVPAPYAKDAAVEALAAGVRTVVVVAEGVPVHDSMWLKAFARDCGARLIGPNTPGVFSPGKAKAGIMPTSAFTPGTIGIVSRSGTLSYETALELSRLGLGQSTFVGVGGDLVVGSTLADIFPLFMQDEETRAVVVIGEIGGCQEEMVADFIRRERPTKPVVAFVAGRQAKPGRRMGHAGALVMGPSGTYDAKIRAFESAGVPLADSPADIAVKVSRLLAITGI